MQQVGSQLRGNERFHNPSWAFADTLNRYMRESPLTRQKLLTRVGEALGLKDASNHKKPFPDSTFAQWLVRSRVPPPTDDNKRAICAFAAELGDLGGELERAHKIAHRSWKLIHNKSAGEIDASVRSALDGIERDWRMELCSPHLRQRLADPVWSALLTSLFLDLPDRVRTLLNVPQISFGCFDRWTPKTSVAGGLSPFVQVHSSNKGEAVQHYAVNLVLEPGSVITHQDDFPGFEYSVVVSGQGYYLVGKSISGKDVKAYPLKAGSCVGYGACLPHAVFCVGTEDLKIGHFCFPYREANGHNAATMPRTPKFEDLGKKIGGQSRTAVTDVLVKLRKALGGAPEDMEQVTSLLKKNYVEVVKSDGDQWPLRRSTAVVAEAESPEPA